MTKQVFETAKKLDYEDVIVEETNNEWVKFLDDLKEISPADYETLRHIDKKYGEINKLLFRAGYRSGWQGACVDILKEIAPQTLRVH
tara:strand:- start:4417 stop:4677 length:261 start_codon:yes stop_codon:yes gene_type:complete